MDRHLNYACKQIEAMKYDVLSVVPNKRSHSNPFHIPNQSIRNPSLSSVQLSSAQLIPTNKSRVDGFLVVSDKTPVSTHRWMDVWMEGPSSSPFPPEDGLVWRWRWLIWRSRRLGEWGASLAWALLMAHTLYDWWCLILGISTCFVAFRLGAEPDWEKFWMNIIATSNTNRRSRLKWGLWVCIPESGFVVWNSVCPSVRLPLYHGTGTDWMDDWVVGW